MKYEFLSEDWLAAVEKLRDSVDGLIDDAAIAGLSININVVGSPAGEINLHLCGSSALRPGSLPRPRTVVTLSYVAAQSLFVSADVAGALEAFMVGELEIEGEVADLVLAQQTMFELTPAHLEFHRKIKELTA